MMYYDEEAVNRQKRWFNTYVENYYSQAKAMGASPRATMMGMSIIMTRGMHKDIVNLITEVMAIDMGDYALILESLQFDRRASTMDKHHNSAWSGIGKLQGTKIFALLSKYGNEEIIERFFELRSMKVVVDGKKRNKYTSYQVKKIIKFEHGFDFEKEL